MNPAKKSPAEAPVAPAPAAQSAPTARVAVAGADARPAPSGAHVYQAMIEARLGEEHARYPRLVRLAIVLVGGSLAWAAVIYAVRLSLSL